MRVVESEAKTAIRCVGATGRAWRCAARVLCGAALLLTACGEGTLGWDGPGEVVQAASHTDSVLALAAPPAAGGAVHLVRLVASGDRYAFEPAEVRIRPGDVVRFVQTSRQPESVAFDAGLTPPGGVAVLRREDARAGPLLARPGAVWNVSFEGAPPGVYPFVSLPHGEFGMRGRVVVTDEMMNVE